MIRYIAHILPLLAATALIGACQKEMPDKIPAPVGDCKLTLTLDLPEAPTKAIDNDLTPRLYESTVNSVSYLVFASNGALEAMNHVIGNNSSGPLDISFGNKTVYAFVNVNPAKFAFVTSTNDLYYMTVDLKDNVLAYNKGLTMYGSTTVSITQNRTTYALPITVSRHVARIVLGRVTNALQGPLAGKDIDVDFAFLTNLSATCPVTGRSFTPTSWYARCGRVMGYSNSSHILSDYEETEAGELTFQHIWDYVSEDDYIEPRCAMYFFPNSISTDVCGWTNPYRARYTRIVVAAEIDGVLYYYPVSITGAQSNKAYTLDLTITRLGSMDPDTFEFCEVQDVVINIGGFDEWDDDFEITF